MPHPHLLSRLLLLAFPLLLFGLASRPGSATAEGEPGLRRNLIVKTVEKAKRAIVSIRTNEIVQRSWYDIWGKGYKGRAYERDGGLGSGAIFHPDGYVMTNAHVISRASKIYVGIPNEGKRGGNGEYLVRRALPLAIDIENDLAILRLLPEPDTVAEKYPYISLGRSNDLMVGESIIAMGHPFRLGLTVTSGIIGALNRRLELGRRDRLCDPGRPGPVADRQGVQAACDCRRLDWPRVQGRPQRRGDRAGGLQEGTGERQHPAQGGPDRCRQRGPDADAL